MVFLCLQPWTLDSSISEENRAVIEKMLLEEEYPFADLTLLTFSSRTLKPLLFPKEIKSFSVKVTEALSPSR